MFDKVEIELNLMRRLFTQLDGWVYQLWCLSVCVPVVNTVKVWVFFQERLFKQYIFFCMILLKQVFYTRLWNWLGVCFFTRIFLKNVTHICNIYRILYIYWASCDNVNLYAKHFFRKTKTHTYLTHYFDLLNMWI